MFEDMIGRVGDDILNLLQHLSGRKLRVATMCTGTESPLVALNLISRALKKKYDITLGIEHVFSCENAPWKLAYVERNFHPPLLFRDVCELNEDEATTAYGAMAPVPGNIDMLIAGTSCIDSLTLDTKREIDTRGDSNRSFRGMMGWVKRHKPVIVILESVCGAPWPSIKNCFEKVDYSAAHARFDTQDFYIPHTRSRGYLYAVRGVDDKVTLNWGQRVKQLEREASVPYDAFLLPVDDPRIQNRREMLGGEESNRGKAQEWAKHETRNARTRLDKQLGNHRPLTNWNENGARKMLDFAWVDWANSQGDRVLDLLDISFLLKAAEGTDTTFKSMLWNLSQNIDREIGSKRHGTCPYLTPTMIRYLSFRGGPMLGLEALSLQGLPVDELNFTRETEDNLADLSGNTMSSTVVGAVMLSALLISRHRLEPGPGTKGRPQGDIMEVDEGEDIEGASKRNIGGDEQLLESSFDLEPTPDSLPLPDLLKRAEKSSLLCTCEGRYATTSSAIGRCEDCNFTSCARCGGQPEHNYRVFDFAKHPRLLPSTFEREASAALPMCVFISGVDIGYVEALKSSVPFRTSIRPDDWKPYITALAGAVSQEFRFRDLKRRATWIATFDSPEGFLEFEMHPTNPEWRLFAKPSLSEPANSHARIILRRAVARLKVKVPNQLLEGVWELAFPLNTEIDVKIEGVVDETVEGRGLVPAWEARLGLEAPHLKTKEVWAKLKLAVKEDDKEQFDDDISGTYRWLPNCAAACRSLHVREEADPSGAPLFFFLDPTKYGENDEDPFVFSRTFRRYEYGEERPIVAKLNPTWRQGSAKESTITCFVDHQWVQAPKASFEITKSRRACFAVPKQRLQFTTSKGGCHLAQAVLTARVYLGEDAPAVWPRSKWVEVDKRHEWTTFRSIAFLLERLHNIPNQDRWIAMSCDEKHGDLTCGACAPKSPDLCWEKRVGRSVAFEDPGQAGEFERTLKGRPPSFVTLLTLDSDGFAHVRIGCNLVSLVHRATSCLPYRTEPLVTSYRITTNYIPPVKLIRPTFQLTSNRRGPIHAQPHSFCIPLRPEQLRSLGWMIRQEAEDTIGFEEEEIAEAFLPPLHWRAEAKVSRRVRVRGGVLADGAGYGKTAITLGLISCANQAHPYKEPKKDATDGLVATKASLVVAPCHLVQQWELEIKKFTGDAFAVRTIVNIAELDKLSIRSILDADIIIVASKLFNSRIYLENLESFAGKGELPAQYGGYWECRHNVSVKGIREQAKCLQKNDATSVMDKIIEGSRIDTSLRERGTPSTKPRGAQDSNHQEAREAWGTGVVSDPSASTPVPTVKVINSSDDALALGEEVTPYPYIVKANGSGLIESGGPKFSKPSATSGSASSMDGAESKAAEEDKEPQPARDYSQASDDKKGPLNEDSQNTAMETAKKALALPPAKSVNVKKRKSNAGSEGADEEGSRVDKGKAPAKKKQKVAAYPRKKRLEYDPWNLKSLTVKGDFMEMTAPPLELFHWHRLVVGEYTHLQEKANAIVASLNATHRWVLSSTPAIQDFASVKAIALFLGLHLGVNDDNEEHASNRRVDMTPVEQFHSFREVRSVDWYYHRYSVGQRFLDQFVRQNTAEPDEIPFEEIPVIIQLPAAERAIERELVHTFLAQEMNIECYRKGKGSRDRRIIQSLKGSKSAEEALLKCVASYDSGQAVADNAMKACDYVSKVRAEELEECKQDIRTTLQLLERQQAQLGSDIGETHYRQWQLATEAEGVGDPDATDAVLELYADVLRGNPGAKATSTENTDRKPATKGKGKAKNTGRDTSDGALPKASDDAAWEHQEATNDLRLLVKELVGRVRTLRYFKTIRRAQQEHSSMQAAFKADCPRCGEKELLGSSLSLLSSCGHIGCHVCVWDAVLEEQCVLGPQNCSATARMLNIVRADSLGTDDNSKDVERHCSRKLEEIIDTIKNHIPREERVLLFIQFPDLTKIVAEAFTANGITLHDVRGPWNALARSKILGEFQHSDKQVLILCLEDEGASGANLTIANHVMFLSPMWPKPGEHYMAIENQAIGHARRYGQTKKVKIWKFIAKDTIDVMVYEQFCGINYQARIAQGPSQSTYSGNTDESVNGVLLNQQPRGRSAIYPGGTLAS